MRSGSVSLSDVRLQGLLDRPELTHCGKRCEFRDCKVDGITRCVLPFVRKVDHFFQILFTVNVPFLSRSLCRSLRC